MANYPYDANLVLHDGTAITSTGVGSVAYFDVGGAFRFPAVAVAVVTAIDATDTNETYDLVIEGSTTSNFSTAVQLASMTVSRSITAPQRFTLPFDNEQGGTVYQYIRFKPVLGGTTPSISANVYLSLLSNVDC